MQALALKELVMQRKCLKCDKEFNSVGPANRICPKCGEVNAKIRIPPRDPNTKETGSGFRRGTDVGAKHG